MAARVKSAHGALTRDLLLEATLRVAAREGVRGVTHRKVAAEAGQSLSTTSYHLNNIDLILLESFSLFAQTTADHYVDALKSASNAHELAQALIKVVHTHRDDPTVQVLMFELYAQATRDERYREMLSAWSRLTMQAVARVVGELNSHKAEILLDGIMLHWLMHSEASFPEADIYEFLMSTFEH